MRTLMLLALCLSCPAWAAEPAAAKKPKPGALTPEAIRDVVDLHRPEVRRCYDAAAAKKPDLAGKVVVFWVIGSDGKVASAEIASTTLNDPSVEGCLTKSVRAWVFPRPKKGTVGVNFPFTFGPPRPSKPAPPATAAPLIQKASTKDAPPIESEPGVLR